MTGCLCIYCVVQTYLLLCRRICCIVLCRVPWYCVLLCCAVSRVCCVMQSVMYLLCCAECLDCHMSCVVQVSCICCVVHTSVMLYKVLCVCCVFQSVQSAICDTTWPEEAACTSGALAAPTSSAVAAACPSRMDR